MRRGDRWGRRRATNLLEALLIELAEARTAAGDGGFGAREPRETTARSAAETTINRRLRFGRAATPDWLSTTLDRLDAGAAIDAAGLRSPER